MQIADKAFVSFLTKPLKYFLKGGHFELVDSPIGNSTVILEFDDCDDFLKSIANAFSGFLQEQSLFLSRFQVTNSVP